MEHQEFNLPIWEKSDYLRLKQYLRELADPDYLAFHQRLVPEVDNLLGVRVPVLRSLAKEIAKGDIDSYFSLTGQESYEEIMLYGLVIGYCKRDIAEVCAALDRFVPKINNWAVCDCCCSGLKIVKKHPEEMLAYLQKWLSSKNEFELRFGIVMLMDYYTAEPYLDMTLAVYRDIRHEGYYVKMAVAWGISVCFVHARSKTLSFLEQCPLDDFTYHKALQKIIESNRVSPEDKALMRSLKRKTENRDQSAFLQAAQIK